MHIEVGAIRYRVSDQGRALPVDVVELRRDARTIAVQVPLGALGQPNRVLLCSTTCFGELPLSVQPWRVVEIAD